MLDAECRQGNAERVGLDYKQLVRDVEPGAMLLLDDGLIKLEVEAVDGPRIVTRVVIGGRLSDNKGINRQGGGLSAPALTAKDKDDLKTAAAIGADFLAVSFPKTGHDMRKARELLRAAGSHAQLIAKIERAEAIPALAEIIEASDGIMVARGDLAVEVGNAAVPGLQKRMIRMARDANKLSITATQMMESMIQNAVPTRAEVSDVANAVLDGTDAVMLSAETATGTLSDRDRRGDGADLRRGREVGGDRVRPRGADTGVHADRPVDRDGGAVHRLPPPRQGDRGAHAVGLDGALDVAPRHRLSRSTRSRPRCRRSARWRSTATCGRSISSRTRTATTSCGRPRTCSSPRGRCSAAT